MKKILKLSALSLLLAVSSLRADFARVEAGAGVWLSNPSGTLKYINNSADVSDTLGYETAPQGYAWLLVKHFIPIIPNVRLEYVDLTFNGNSKQTFNWNSNIAVSTNIGNEVSMKQIDAILYYNILDNTFWTTVDFGVDIKYIDSSFTIDPDTTGIYQGYTNSTPIAIPMAYVRSRVQIPFSGLGLEADAKYIGFNKSKVMDVRAKIDYTLNITPVIQPGVELGYRIQKIDIDENDVDVKMNLDFSGVYAGIMLRF